MNAIHASIVQKAAALQDFVRHRLVVGMTEDGGPCSWGLCEICRASPRAADLPVPRHGIHPAATCGSCQDDAAYRKTPTTAFPKTRR